MLAWPFDNNSGSWWLCSSGRKNAQGASPCAAAGRPQVVVAVARMCADNERPRLFSLWESDALAGWHGENAASGQGESGPDYVLGVLVTRGHVRHNVCHVIHVAFAHALIWQVRPQLPQRRASSVPGGSWLVMACITPWIALTAYADCTSWLRLGS